MQEVLNNIFNVLGLDNANKRQSSLSISSKKAPKEWKAFSFDTHIFTLHIIAYNAKLSDIRSFISGISNDNYILLITLNDQNLLVLKGSKYKQPTIINIDKDYDKIINVLKKLDFKSNVLMAHASLNKAIELLSSAGKYFINRGIFSNHFLNERLFKELKKRGRDIKRESSNLKLDIDDPKSILNALGYKLSKVDREYSLYYNGKKLDACTIITDAKNLDIRSNNEVPSYIAVSMLAKYTWVILTNGIIWRLYTSKVQSSSTNYFEIDIDGINENDPKLEYFIALFSAKSLIPRDGISDLDYVYEGGIKYAREVEDDLKTKIFEGELFINLVKAIIDHSPSKRFEQNRLDEAKELSLKLLYRLLFILYAESRGLLPIEHKGYQDISLSNLCDRLGAFQDESFEAWDSLQRLFKAISNGSKEANLPQYNGDLFAPSELDKLKIKNKHLVKALKDLTEINGKRIDYSNLGVRHLGSLYEALLEYTVMQADKDLVIYDDQILDASYASDLKSKPKGFIAEGELYLSVKGLARKGTGSYFTPDPIVKFLVKKGLEPILADREARFKDIMTIYRKNRDDKSREESKHILFDIQILDPAMGSGHFLVEAVNQLSSWMMSLLEKYPDAPLLEDIEKQRINAIDENAKRGISIDQEMLTFNVILKRMIMKQCIFGVDINPLAVELAKLSLWLDSFAIGMPLTYLDHHIKCGDSLIGSWLSDLEKNAQNDLMDKWLDDVSSKSTMLKSVTMPLDVTIDEVSKSKSIHREYEEHNKPKRFVLDLLTASVMDEEIAKKRPKNLKLVEEMVIDDRFRDAEWHDIFLKAMLMAEKYRFFHWELEFTDAFTDARRGFDLIVMNPPWDAVKPEDDDFFSMYYHGFRRIKNKQDKLKIKKQLLQDSAIKKAYDEYYHSIEYRNKFYKESKQYEKRGKGDTDLWKLFLEQAMNLLTDQGILSIIIPSGIVNNEGAKELRRELLNWNIRYLYEFENREGIFPIDSRYKFVLLVVDKSKPKDRFSAAFYLHKLDALDNKVEQEKFLEYPTELIKVASPNSLIIPECRNQREIEILRKIYDNNPLLEDNNKPWNVSFVTELHRTSSSKLFRSDGKGWQLIEGKHFHQFIPDYDKPIFTVNPEEGLRATSKIKAYGLLNREIHQVSRLAFRNVASSTNVRSMISCIIPKHTFLPNSASIVVPKIDGKLSIDDNYYKLITYLEGVFNSMTFDFLIRLRVTMNLNFFYVYQTPVPKDIKSKIAEEIMKLAARLNAIDDRFKDLADAFNIECKPLSMRERVELTAKLDALVAKHYQLSREEYEYILNTFKFDEDDSILDLKADKIVWNDTLIRKFNGAVKKLALKYYDMQ
ncbi:MAG: restriction endonuclease [Candidatus Nitrosocaldaceae archaeon]|nr:MAG: restriction endonuclease [Candidatus Nitrosocaldaceae archaeon]